MPEQVLQEGVVRRQHTCKANRSNGSLFEGLTKANKRENEGMQSRVTALRGCYGSVEDGPINRGFPVDEWFL